MKIRIRDVSSAGLPLEQKVYPREIGFAEDFLNPEALLSVQGILERSGNFIFAKIQVTCLLEDSCARCLERISRSNSFSCAMEFELLPGEEYIDVGQKICEELIINHPPRILCKDDCRGICVDCGAELNREDCQCQANKSIKESR